jgi:hypothetical protein
MPRPQFTIRALWILLLVVACFFGGIRFEREPQKQEDELAGQPVQFAANTDVIEWR